MVVERGVAGAVERAGNYLRMSEQPTFFTFCRQVSNILLRCFASRSVEAVSSPSRPLSGPYQVV
jgi:hypothetical protein